jgi:tetratricopeptide (TPR) repeat protein
MNAFLNANPFHAGALYTMAMMFKAQGNYERAEELYERLLYTYQLAFHHQFTPLTGQCQIDRAHCGLCDRFL